MRHYFLVNPIAGGRDSSLLLEERLHNIFLERQEPYDIYITQGPNDLTFQIKKVCQVNESLEQPEDITFYICGGDGSCFEAVNGIIGYPHARMTIIPVGSCNDFLKMFPNDNFMDIQNLIDGEEHLIDVLRVNGRYCLNEANIGYDAKVNDDCVKYRYKYKTVKSSYNHAIVRNLLKPLGDLVTIVGDGQEVFNKKALLMAFTNGTHYGGGYNCAPNALCDDGLLEMIIVKKVSILTFARLIKYYKNGLHLNNPRFSKIITYKQLKKVTVTSPNLLCLCLDGETFYAHKIDIEIVPQILRFVFPKK